MWAEAASILVDARVRREDNRDAHRISPVCSVHAGSAAGGRRGRLERDGVKLLREKGMTVKTDINKAPFQEAVEPAYKIYTDQYGSEMLDRIRASGC